MNLPSCTPPSQRWRLQAATAVAASLLLTACGSKPPRRPAPASPAGTTGSTGQGISRMNAEQASDLAIHALGLVGTPYRYGGNTPESGFDCSGLIGYVYRHRAGVSPPRTVAQLSGFGQSVPQQALRTGDLVLFGNGSRPTHAGIYVGNQRFVHAPSSGGTVRLDRMDGPYWSRQAQFYRRP